MVPVEGVKQGVGGGEVRVWETSPSVWLGQGRWVWRQGLVIRVCLARRSVVVVVVVVWRPGGLLGAVLLGRPVDVRLGSFDRRSKESGVHAARSWWAWAVLSCRGGGLLLICHLWGVGSGGSSWRLVLAGSAGWR